AKEPASKLPSKKADPKPKPPAPVPKPTPVALPVAAAPAPKPDKGVAPSILSKPVADEKSRKAPQGMPAEHVKQCRKVWRKMFNHRSSAHFRMPVDPIAENIPHYPEIVDKPMDLSTIKTNLDNGKYANLQAFEEDVRLMLNNCFKFNPIGTYVYNQGQELETVFENEWAGVLENVGAKVPEMNITIVETPKGLTAVTPATAPTPSKSTTSESLPAGSKSSSAPRKLSFSKQPPVPAYIPPSVSTTDRVPSPIPQSGSSVHKEKSSATAIVSQPSVPSPSKGSSSGKSSDLSKCKKILKKLMADSCAFEFLQPVDPIRQGIPLYPKIITHPMDLGTVQQKLRADAYNSAGEVRGDIELVIFNCRKFNPRETYVVKQADALEKLMLSEWEVMFGSSSYNGSGGHGADSGANKDASVASSSSKSKSKSAKTEDALKSSVSGDNAASGTAGARRSSNTPKPKPAKVVEKVEPPKDVVEKHMEKILKKCMNHKHAGPFLEPVDWKALNLPNYPLLIKNPMDFSTIRKKLTAGKYATMDDFADDVRQISQNCVNFNGLDHPFSQGGLMIQTMCNKEVENAKKDLARLYPTSSYAVASVPGGAGTVGAVGSGKAKSAVSEELNGHRKIIERLKLNPDFGAFAVPVDPIALGIPTYFDIIKHPMDFGTIEKKLIAGNYTSGAEVIRDVNLVFSNCALFNSHPGDLVAAMGERLKKTWENMVKKEGLNNPKPVVSGAASIPLASTAKSKTDSTAPPKKTASTSAAGGSPSKPKSSSATAKIVPAYIPPSASSPGSSGVVLSSPSLPSPSHQARRGSSTPAPTPLRKVMTASGNGGSSKLILASSSSAPLPPHQSSTLSSSKSSGHYHHSNHHSSRHGSSSSKHGRNDLSSDSGLSEPEDDDDDASKSSSVLKSIRLKPPQLMSPPSARYDSDPSRKKKRPSGEDHYRSYDDDEDDDGASSSSSKRRKGEREYSEEYASSSSTRREHKHHKSSSSRERKEHKEHREYREHKEHKEHREHREHREHKKHKKSRKHKKHKKRSSEDRDRERYHSDDDDDQDQDLETSDRERYY
ncbi:hypothetical protein BGZ54_003615, partial [Gamsiella multidivaricata]